jgi:crotonobetaine/carnitine-CoA ligase
VVEAAAIPVPDPQRGEEVKIFVVLRAGLTRDDFPPEQILAFSGERLAKFKVPRYVEYAEPLPRTASGKIAKHVLKSRPDQKAGAFDQVERVWR